MARTIRTIEAVASSSGMEVDRKAGIIHGVKILGLVSDNNRKYMPEAVRKAKSLYEGIKVNIDHPAESGDVRSAEDRFGKLINVEYVEGEGLYGDLMFLKSHPMAERICEAAERNDMNDTFGLSHNAQGDGQEDDDGCFVVSSIVEVRHVDLVADPATTKSLREARTRMKSKESKAEDNKSSRANVWKMNLKTYQISGGKKVLVLSKEAETTISSNGSTSNTRNVNNYGLLLAIAKSPKSGSYSTLGTSPKMHYEWSGGKIVKTIEESDMRDDKDEIMTEATDFENSAIKREQDQLLAMPTAKVLAYHVNNTGGYIKSKYTAAEVGGKQALIGDILRAKFPKKTVDEFFAWEDAKKKNKNRKPKPKYGDHLLGEAKKLKEADMPDDEDKEMTEAEDMPVEDPSEEEEMTESYTELKPVLSTLEKAIDSIRSTLNDIGKKTQSAAGLVKDKTSKAYVSNIDGLISDASKLLQRVSSGFSRLASNDSWYTESEGDPDEDDMPMDEADGMSIDDITDKPAVEAYGEEDDMPVDEADDKEKMAMEGSSDDVGKTPREWDAHFEKQSKRMQDAINVGLMRGRSYPDAVKQARIMVKEAIGDDEEDKMTMESKRRRLNTFCRNNGVTLTEGLYKDLRLLPDIAQRRCILRIKLASKARKPRSSGSMMPMTESKIHTGDNVFNWLRS